MAIVKEIKSRWGGTILVDDSAYRGVPEAELQRRRDETGRVILEIDRRVQLARLAAENNERQGATT